MQPHHTLIEYGLGLGATYVAAFVGWQLVKGTAAEHRRALNNPFVDRRAEANSFWASIGVVVAGLALVFTAIWL